MKINQNRLNPRFKMKYLLLYLYAYTFSRVLGIQTAHVRQMICMDYYRLVRGQVVGDQAKWKSHHVHYTWDGWGGGRIFGYRSHETQRGRCHFKAQNSIWMSEKSCSVRLVTGTVILRNSKANVLFLISPITFLREHIAKYEGGTEGKKRYSEAFRGVYF